MPGILKIGMTERTPPARLDEANSSDTWRPPTAYAIEIAKKVYDPKQKEATLHRVLDFYGKRINPRREFFNATIGEIKLLFDLIDGEQWKGEEGEEDYEDEDDDGACSMDDDIDDDYNEEILNIENESWKEYEPNSRFWVSDQGRVKRVHPDGRSRLIRPAHCGRHYAIVDGDDRFLLRYMVAKTWTANPTNDPYVKHINGNAHDNRACNLTWYSKTCKGGRPRKDASGTSRTEHTA